MSTIDGKSAAERKAVPLATGVLDYFPDALLAVAELSRIGNDQHNPGQPLHWSRGKSNDHPDCLLRHFVDRGKLDTDKVRHSVKVAWRALAIAQLEIEAAADAQEVIERRKGQRRKFISIKAERDGVRARSGPDGDMLWERYRSNERRKATAVKTPPR